MKQRGTTLIEMLILAVIVSIIIAVAIPMLTSGPHVKYSDSNGCTKQVQPEAKPQGF
jgi:competence protein ComGC